MAKEKLKEISKRYNRDKISGETLRTATRGTRRTTGTRGTIEKGHPSCNTSKVNNGLVPSIETILGRRR